MSRVLANDNIEPNLHDWLQWELTQPAEHGPLLQAMNWVLLAARLERLNQCASES
jgi:hypothetical protein